MVGGAGRPVSEVEYNAAQIHASCTKPALRAVRAAATRRHFSLCPTCSLMHIICPSFYTV